MKLSQLSKRQTADFEPQPLSGRDRMQRWTITIFKSGKSSCAMASIAMLNNNKGWIFWRLFGDSTVSQLFSKLPWFPKVLTNNIPLISFDIPFYPHHIPQWFTSPLESLFRWCQLPGVKKLLLNCQKVRTFCKLASSHIEVRHHLVGGWALPLWKKYGKISLGMIIPFPIWWENPFKFIKIH